MRLTQKKSEIPLVLPQVELDICTKLVQIGAMNSIPRPNTQRKRFSIALDMADYEALQKLGAEQRPPLKQQYLVELAIKNLLEQHADRQFSFPLKQPSA